MGKLHDAFINIKQLGVSNSSYIRESAIKPLVGAKFCHFIASFINYHLK